MKKQKLGNKLYKIDDKKRITLPDELLKEFELEVGDYIKFEVTSNGKIEIKKISIPT